MTERSAREDFGRWVEPHLPVLARYAGRRIGPVDRDAAIEEALIRAWQRRASYDESHSAEVWLLEILAQVCRRPRSVRRQSALVDLVDETVVRPAGAAVDLAEELDAFDDRDRLLADLHYFVGLDVATVAEVLHCEPGQVATPLLGVRVTLARLTGDDDARVEARLLALGREWRDGQSPPPEVPLARLDTPLHGTRARPRTVVAAAAGVLLVGAGALAVLHSSGGHQAAHRVAAATPAPRPRPKEIVPFRDLRPHNPAFGHDSTGAVVTPYDDVSATGSISGTVHPGDTLEFEAVLTSPGLLPLHPCPDYTITFGAHSVRRALNCKQVPFYASIVTTTDKDADFTPILPAGVAVSFRMAVVVPDDVGRQQVSWTLDGPTTTPRFSGAVDVIDAR